MTVYLSQMYTAVMWIRFYNYLLDPELLIKDPDPTSSNFQ